MSATEESEALYAARGWQLWPGTASMITPDGIERTEDEEGAIFVLPLRAKLTLDGDLAAEWRAGDVW